MSEPWNQTTRYFVITLFLIFATAFIYYIRDLLSPLVIAGFTAYLLSPLVGYFSRVTHLSRRVSANIVYFISLAVLIGVISSLIPVLISQAEEISRAFVMVVDGLKPLLEKPLELGVFSLNLEPLLPTMQGLFSQFTAPMLEDALHVLESTSKNTLYFLLIVVGIYYIMVDWSDLREWALRLAPEHARHDLRRLYWEIRGVWMAYLRGQIMLMLVVGIVFTIIYIFIGLPGAILVGILTGLLTLIPDLGPFIGTVVAVIVALLEGSTVLPLTNFWFAVVIVIIYSVLMIIKNIWLRPYIMGRAVQMHEGLVFVAIIAAVIFSGILGALIVVPVIASLAVIGRYVRLKLLGLPPFPGVKSDNPIAPTEDFPEQAKMHPKRKKEISQKK